MKNLKLVPADMWAVLQKGNFENFIGLYIFLRSEGTTAVVCLTPIFIFLKGFYI